MAMWSRVKRVFRSFVGWFVELGEDPELILKQNIRDLEDQLPTINESIAQLKANENLLKKQLAKEVKEEAELAAKIKAALKHEKRDLALNFATTLEKVRASKKDTEEEMKLASSAYERMVKHKRQFLQLKERKVNEVRTALNAKRKAEWQASIADAMQQVTPGGVDMTHDDMLRKIDEQAAMSEAKLEVALEGADTDSIDIEAEASKLRANETLREFELELGMAADISAPPEATGSEKTIGPRERELA